MQQHDTWRTQRDTWQNEKRTRSRRKLAVIIAAVVLAVVVVFAGARIAFGQEALAQPVASTAPVQLATPDATDAPDAADAATGQPALAGGAAVELAEEAATTLAPGALQSLLPQDDAAPVEPWDGITQTEPAKSGNTYQIGTGAELAWFATQVNAGTGTSYNAALTADIDLGDKPWTPVGTGYSKTFKGTFDGNGHQVRGLFVQNSWAQAGLFGYLGSGATIRNIVVAGAVEAENNAAGGLVSRADGTVLIQNCGNLVDVRNKANSGKAAGIVGWADGAATISGCFNRGSIVSGDRASGIVADTGTSAKVVNCYNTGAITGSKANGIGSATGIAYSNCYNTGALNGSSTAYAIGASNYGTYENCYFLDGTAATQLTAEDAPVALTAAQMKAPAFVQTLGASAWQVDVGAAVNGGFPLLAWEPVSAAQGVQLATPTGLAWLDQEPLDEEGIDIAYEMMQAVWSPVEGASGYQVKLYRAGDAANPTPEPVFTSEIVQDASFDFFEAFAALGTTDSARYVFTVTAIGDGEYYLDSAESAPDAEGFAFDGAAFVPAPAQTLWNEASKIAVWKRVEGAEFYVVTLYRATSGDGATKVASYTLGKEIVGTQGDTVSQLFISNMASTGDYFFTVRAGREVPNGPNAGKHAASALAISTTTNYQAPEGETVEIATADDWMRIVNTTHEGTAYATDADAQNVEWSKNYVITADLDFSNLSAEQQAQTKSWGNVDARFNGTLDGQGHTITGLTLANGDNGLFAYIGERGTVKNLVVDKANVLFNNNAGIFCVYNYGTISNCAVKNTNIASDYSGVIAGFLARNFGLVEDSYVEGGSLTTTTSTGNGHAGFVGNNSGAIRRCWTSMDVTSNSYCEGGFCGWVDEHYDDETHEHIGGSFENCFALGSVSAAQGWSGGFVGRVNSSRATFTNCYAAGPVTSGQNPEHAHGFFGSMGGEGPRALSDESASSFYITLPAENCVNCYYCTDRTPQDNPAGLAQGKALDDMRTDEFAQALGMDWQRTDGVNEGLPYLRDMPAPQASELQEITVHVAVADYDTDDYAFSLSGNVFDVTFETAGNARVVDAMQAAAAQGLISYNCTVTPAYGSFVEAINGKALTAPDGWMFTVNDDQSDVGIQLATVRDGDQLLWYPGTPANNFTAPAWQDLTGQAPVTEWVDIATADDLVALTRDDADMAGSYRLAANINLAGVNFMGIGSHERPFSGVFKGKGFTISNLTINRPDDHNVGLFNFIRGAELNNIALRNVDVTGCYSVGALVGVADTVLDTTSRAKCTSNLIGGCSATGKVTSANADVGASSDGAYAGGLVGFNNGETDQKTGISVASSIDRCMADVEVVARAMYAGGLVGGNYGTVTNSTAKGAVSGGDCTGGLLGGNVGSVYDSGATGNVSGGSRTGGFCGDNYNDAIERCYSTGNVAAAGQGIERIGGFVGDSGGTVRHCSSSGAVTTSAEASYVGAFAGYYTGALTGLYVRITFEDNCGWAPPAAEGASALAAIGNMKSSTNESEQAVLDASRAADWQALRGRFDELHGVALPETAPDPGAGGGDDPGSGGDDPGPAPTADDVRALINAIGVIQLDENGALPAATKAAIDAARSAYDALPDDQKALVGNIGALETAEEMYAELERQVAGGGSGSGSDSGSGDDNGGGSGHSATPSDGSAADRDIDAITPTDAVADAAAVSPSLAKPAAKSFTTTVKPKAKTIRANFAKAAGAKNYRVAFRKAGARQWSYRWTSGKASFALKGLKAGGLYEYKVAGFAKQDGRWARSDWSASTYCWLQGTTLTLRAGKASAKAIVGKVKGAAGYQLRWSAKKSLANAKAKKLVGAKKTKATLKKLRAGRKTFVQVVPYKKHQGHVYYGAAVKRAVKAK
ncbi:MAG TPA: hypothetical protein DCP91_13650 [Eggerthellaceae bacterium]|nr:hypothetical protein [Eggerthellaceae bacterium]